MPYITSIQRKRFEKLLLPFHSEDYRMGHAGSLNYVVTTILNAYLKQHNECYKTYNDIIGVLECAKLEYYRRKISDYEDAKMKENGDV